MTDTSKFATNADSPLLAALLADARVGTFTGLIRRKLGEEKGGVRYGDDVIHTVILTGFKYDRLVQRSLDALPGVTDQEIVDLAAAKGLCDAKTSKPVCLADVAAARAELIESFNKTLNPNAESESSTAHVYEPLVVNGEVVRSARVYRCVKNEGHKCYCRDCTGIKSAPKDGTVYLQGLAVFTTVLEAAANGPVPPTKSSAKTLAKNLLRSKLPISRYVSHPLEKGADWVLRAGGTAAVEAQKAGFVVTDEIINVLARAA